MRYYKYAQNLKKEEKEMHKFKEKDRELMIELLKSTNTRVSQDIEKTFDLLGMLLAKRDELVEALARREGKILDFNSEELNVLEKDFVSLCDSLKELEKIRNEIREQIYNVIKEVSKKHSRPKKANTFTISFSEMINNVWSPTFYDYEEMEKLLLEKLDKSNAISLIDIIENLYEDRR